MGRIDVHTIRREQILDADELLLAVLEKVSRMSNDRFFTLLQEQRTWHDKLDLIVRSNLSPTDKEREMSMLNLHLLSLAAQRPEIAQSLRQTYASSVQRAQAEIEQAIVQGHVKRHDSAAVAAVIQMLVIGMSFG